MIYLKDIPNGSKLLVKTSIHVLPQEAIYDHPDGMYSYCYLVDNPSKVFHLSLFTPLKLVGDHYEIIEEDN